jgi:hypothetical protein
MRYFEPVEMPANNLRNLFEMPVSLFRPGALAPRHRQAGPVQLALAWTYVALRALHSFIHIVVKKVPRPFPRLSRFHHRAVRRCGSASQPFELAGTSARPRSEPPALSIDATGSSQGHPAHMAKGTHDTAPIRATRRS